MLTTITTTITTTIITFDTIYIGGLYRDDLVIDVHLHWNSSASIDCRVESSL